jgi:hypothetical protein
MVRKWQSPAAEFVERWREGPPNCLARPLVDMISCRHFLIRDCFLASLACRWCCCCRRHGKRCTAPPAAPTR